MGLLNLVSRKAESPLLKEGDSIVHLISFVDCTSFQDVEIRDGKLEVIGLKSVLPKWATPTNQTAVLIGNESGVCCDRLNHDSFKKPYDLTKEEQESGSFSVSGDYAITMVNGVLDRIPKPSGSVVCLQKAQSFLSALAQGVEGVNVVEEAIANKTPFIVNIKKVTWTNPATNAVSVQYRFNSFKAIKDGVVPTMKVAGLVIPEDLAS